MRGLLLLRSLLLLLSIPSINAWLCIHNSHPTVQHPSLIETKVGKKKTTSVTDTSFLQRTKSTTTSSLTLRDDKSRRNFIGKVALSSMLAFVANQPIGIDHANAAASSDDPLDAFGKSLSGMKTISSPSSPLSSFSYQQDQSSSLSPTTAQKSAFKLAKPDNKGFQQTQPTSDLNSALDQAIKRKQVDPLTHG